LVCVREDRLMVFEKKGQRRIFGRTEYLRNCRVRRT
jgi:hypothetical protein